MARRAVLLGPSSTGSGEVGIDVVVRTAVQIRHGSHPATTASSMGEAPHQVDPVGGFVRHGYAVCAAGYSTLTELRNSGA